MQKKKFKAVSQYTGEMVYGQLIRGENNFSIFTEFKRLDDGSESHYVIEELAIHSSSKK